MGPHIDRDDAVVMELLRAALLQSGLSQAAFARALGTSASRMSTYLGGRTRPSGQFVVRAHRVGAALERARRSELASAPATSLEMRKHLFARDVGRVRSALVRGRQSLVAILATEDPVLLDAWGAEPISVGSLAWDQLLAAMTAREHEVAGRAAPSWTDREPLAEPWAASWPIEGVAPQSADELLAETPEWLLRHNIMVPSGFLDPV